MKLRQNQVIVYAVYIILNSLGNDSNHLIDISIQKAGYFNLFLAKHLDVLTNQIYAGDFHINSDVIFHSPFSHFTHK